MPQRSVLHKQFVAHQIGHKAPGSPIQAYRSHQEKVGVVALWKFLANQFSGAVIRYLNAGGIGQQLFSLSTMTPDNFGEIRVG